MTKIKTISYWILKVALALIFLSAAGAKLSGQPMMVNEFAQIGLGQWFRYFTAAIEIFGAAMLIWPKTTFFGALALTCVCIGAFVAQISVLRMDWIHTIVLGAITAAIAWSQRDQLTALRPQTQ